MASVDPSTEAVISVTGSATSYGLSDFMEGLSGGIVSDAARAALADTKKQDLQVQTTLVNTVEFSYSSDMMQLGDPFTVVIPNPRGEYTDKFIRGQRIHLYLRNPRVKSNQMTLKHTGIIVRRRQTASARGSIIQLDCADLGWHLTHNDAWLFYRLSNKPFYDLLRDPKFIDPSWGIQGLSTDTKVDNDLRRGVNNARAQAQLDLAALGTLVYLQVEPGDKVADLICQYARRINRIVNVSCDGFLQVWQPNYNRTPLYTIEFHGFDDPTRNRNNVLDVSVDEDISNIYTDVTCIGELVGGDLTLNPSDQNANKRRGSFINRFALPFIHRLNFADGDIFDVTPARKQAKWRYDRGIFDSWQAVYVVKGHHQNGEWWESDQLCTVRDSVHGIDTVLYVSSVRYDRDSQGDRTTVTLRKPGLLQAAFGVLPMPPRITGSLVDNSGTSTTQQPKVVVKKPQK